MDLHGFNPHPTEPSSVKLRAYDVDQAGSSSCASEIDKVYLNGVYLGDLTGADDQWSTVTFDIPAGTLSSGQNGFLVDIDAAETDCWCVTVDYAEIELPFKVARTEASAFDDVPIRRGNTDDHVTDPFWKTEFDVDGNLTNPAPTNDAIADKIEGSWFFDWGARRLTYQYHLETWPTGATPDWEPTVKYYWEVEGTSHQSPDFEEAEGWEDSFDIIIPDEVGAYTLRVTLKIYYETELISTEVREHTLYVVLDDPVSEIEDTSFGITISVEAPREFWLERATGWGSGARDKESLLIRTNGSEYANPFAWTYGYKLVGYDSSGQPVLTKDTVVDMAESTGGNFGDCFSFRDVWRLFAGSLGVSTSWDSYEAGGGFVTSTKAALDNSTANVQPESGTGLDPRWLFGNHQFGMSSSWFGTLYDPTFGIVGGGKDDNVACYPDGTWILDAGYTYNVCPLKADPTRSLLFRPTSGSNGGNWTIYYYKEASTPTAMRVAGRIAIAGIGSFTGTVSDAVMATVYMKRSSWWSTWTW